MRAKYDTLWENFFRVLLFSLTVSRTFNAFKVKRYAVFMAGLFYDFQLIFSAKMLFTHIIKISTYGNSIQQGRYELVRSNVRETCDAGPFT